MLRSSIDIVNAFNLLSCEKIMETLEHYMFSWYLRNWRGNYLGERSIEFSVEGAKIVEREVDLG